MSYFGLEFFPKCTKTSLEYKLSKLKPFKVDRKDKSFGTQFTFKQTFRTEIVLHFPALKNDTELGKTVPQVHSHFLQNYPHLLRREMKVKRDRIYKTATALKYPY